MIIVENCKVELKGKTPNILTDLTFAIKAIRQSITEETNAEVAKEMIDKCVELAFMDEKEVYKAATEEKRKFIKDLLEDDEFLNDLKEILKEGKKE